MSGKTIITLAAELTTGAITADYIKKEFGDGVLSTVLALAGGGIAAIAAHSALDTLNEHTGIVDDIGGLVDDVLSIF